MPVTCQALLVTEGTRQPGLQQLSSQGVLCLRAMETKGEKGLLCWRRAVVREGLSTKRTTTRGHEHVWTRKWVKKPSQL